MLSTRNVISNVKSVPATWIFEYYCRLQERLGSDEVKIHSVFKDGEDKTPSMSIFFSDKYKKFWFHDFATGKHGDCYTLVQELLGGASFGVAANRILSDYTKFLQNHEYKPIEGPVVVSKYVVTHFQVRQWNRLDANYWLQFNIGSELLGKYNVRPLDCFTLKKTNSSDEHEFTVDGEFIYGYFKEDGRLYKIYRPKKLENKFIKIEDHVQGYEQLTDKPCCLIQASMKDGLATLSLDINADFVAPDSENSKLPDYIVRELLYRYNGRVFVLFDNDEAGIKMMKYYRETYGLKTILLRLAKDVADANRDKGPDVTRAHLVPMIDRHLNSFTQTG